MMRKWLEDSAAGMQQDRREFVKLEVTPGELVAKQKGDTWQLKAVAVWSDGTAGGCDAAVPVPEQQ